MRRLATFGLAIVLTLGLAVGATQAGKKKPKRVKTEAEIELINITPGGTDISGDVHSRKPKCEKGRSVTVVVDAPDESFDTVTTDRTGDWAVSSDDVVVGTFVAEVARKRVGQGEKKLVCKAATSPPMSVGGG